MQKLFSQSFLRFLGFKQQKRSNYFNKAVKLAKFYLFSYKNHC